MAYQSSLSHSLRPVASQCPEPDKFKPCIKPEYSQTSVHEHNNSVYEQIFRTQSVSDDVLCFKLRTRKPSKRRQKQITLDNFLVRQRPSGSEAESSGAKRQKRKRIPFQTITFHFLTTFHLHRQLSSIQVR